MGLQVAKTIELPSSQDPVPGVAPFLGQDSEGEGPRSTQNRAIFGEKCVLPIELWTHVVTKQKGAVLHE